ncbi:hypothetical protein LC087_13420 [Bacillus carboniphilus]|uniref:Lipoprotein n=1 Tax=Bacillus carboniphilus TaxID=86663 RepID=A0ABY9JTS5_9BACI|nr:hypothetical protein [Bacillus carboniphilus]WLR41835.1 hypothetical protein LC087_13420 [Bacillus carboniphilus]
MKTIIYFIFGKPNLEHMFFRGVYWFGVVFYFLAIPILIAQSFISGEWVINLISITLFPIIFRMVYSVNRLFHRSDKKVSKRLIIIFGSFFLFITLSTGAIFASVFFFGENVAMNVSKTSINGDVKLTIGSLKGHSSVESFHFQEKPQSVVVIPYEASVKEGDVVIYLEHSGNVIWERKIDSSRSGEITFEGEIGDYEVGVYAEEAKNINLNLSFE